MASFDPTDPSAPEEGPQREERVDLRRKVSLKFKEFQGFINEYSENVSTGGMFIRTASPQPPGTVFDFELTLGEDFKLIHGIGEVVWARDDDEGFDRPAGMGVRFLSLDPESRKLVDRIVSERLAREALHGFSRGAAGSAPESPREEWRLDAPAAAAPLPGAAGGGASARPEEPWWSEGSVPEGAQGPGGLEPPPPPSPPPPTVPPESSDPAPETDAQDFPPPPGPSPYSRSYAGSGVARPGRRRRRPLLLGLVAAAVLVAVATGFFLIFPETAARLLAGGGPDGEPGTVAARPAGGDEGRGPEPGGGSGGAEDAPPAQEPRPATGAEPAGTPGEDGDPAADGAGELGFFEATGGAESDPPPEGRSSGGTPPAPAPPPQPQPEPEPQPPPPPAPEPSAGGVSRVLNVVWEARGDEVLVTVHLDGTIREWEYSVTRVGAPPPRDLVRIRGVDRPFPRPTIPVGHPLLERIRLGFHPEERENELHLVLDLPREMVGIDRSEAVGRELRLYVSPTGGGRPQTP